MITPEELVSIDQCDIQDGNKVDLLSWSQSISGACVQWLHHKGVLMGVTSAQPDVIIVKLSSNPRADWYTCITGTYPVSSEAHLINLDDMPLELTDQVHLAIEKTRVKLLEIVRRGKARREQRDEARDRAIVEAWRGFEERN